MLFGSVGWANFSWDNAVNEYTAHMIKKFYRSYINRTFDQDDVTLFLISARDYCKRNKSMREIGDFIAHPGARDRGITLSSVTDVTPYFEVMLQAQYNFSATESEYLPYRGIGTRDDLLEDLQSIFDMANAGTIDRSPESPEFREFLFCIIFLLCKFSIKIKNQKLLFEIQYSKDLSLNIRYESTVYPRHYANLTVIRIRDVWKELPTSIFHTRSIKVTNHIARRFNRGFLCAVPYESDLALSNFEDGDFEEGAMFPISD